MAGGTVVSSAQVCARSTRWGSGLHASKSPRPPLGAWASTDTKPLGQHRHQARVGGNTDTKPLGGKVTALPWALTTGSKAFTRAAGAAPRPQARRGTALGGGSVVPAHRVRKMRLTPRPPKGPARHLLPPRAGVRATGPPSGLASGRRAAPEPYWRRATICLRSVPKRNPGGLTSLASAGPSASPRSWAAQSNHFVANPGPSLALPGRCSCRSSAAFWVSLSAALSLRRLSFSACLVVLGGLRPEPRACSLLVPWPLLPSPKPGEGPCPCRSSRPANSCAQGHPGRNEAG